jgi:hypothetical protein
MNTQNNQANNKVEQPATPSKKIIVMKKLENTGNQNKQQQQKTTPENIYKTKQLDNGNCYI